MLSPDVMEPSAQTLPLPLHAQGAPWVALCQKVQAHTGTVGAAIEMEHFSCYKPQAQELKSTGPS